MATVLTENLNILLVEDDDSLAQWISDYLISHKFNILHAEDGEQAIQLFNQHAIDLVILDLNLPKLSGFEVCQHIRGQHPTPILMLTASSEDNDEIKGLELGVSDFMHKPVRPRVLLAHIQALLRREKPTNTEQLQFGQLVIEKVSREVKLKQNKIDLTANEFDLLWLLASQAGQIVSRETLLKALRGLEYDGFDRSIDISISRLRKKLGDTAQPSEKIKTIRAKGYLFNQEAWHKV
ncbi:RstA family transcriptional regulator [Catenovulum agarivorans DS-2]|uniref:RstA family transcriptional regulator n=1 Tax=Catenovulum agarivorans DS-2 TaxID=1328313 RepID=W7Q6K2_9ALTE|nr:response regulator transcription factor [Catenovulum agarivorans]EWH08394.1 RstA family transcriptional regulator [Catenovulum agarivorans DS-2]